MSDRIRDAIERKLTLARAATPGPWTKEHGKKTVFAEQGPKGFVVASVGADFSWPSHADAEHIAANDPSSVIRACEAALRALERHPGEVCSDHPNGASHMICIHCDGDWPCDEIGDLADAFGVNLEETA